MHSKIESAIARWLGAGIIDGTTGDRLRAFEELNERPGIHWSVVLAVSSGGVLLAAGILLFVAAHWDDLSPAQRFSLVLFLVAVFHVAGAWLSQRFRVLSTVMHAVGTTSLGAGIYMAGQIFNLDEHWPGGLLIWAAGAWLGWLLLRDWVQASLAALLTPAWLAGEWTVATELLRGGERVSSEGLLFLAITFLTARTSKESTPLQLSLTWIGGLALIPCTFLLIESGHVYFYRERSHVPTALLALAWTLALGLPLLTAFAFRGREAWKNLLALAWVVVLGTTAKDGAGQQQSVLAFAWSELGVYFWCALGSVILILWGLNESRRDMINLGIAGFAVTVITFYFSSVMDKLGRSVSLIGFGLVFLVVGWGLEKTRRRLMKRLEASP